MRTCYCFFIFIFLNLSSLTQAQTLHRTEAPSTGSSGFVSTREGQFIQNGKPFRFVGANVVVMYDETPDRMPETLREVAKDGVRVIRIWASGEGEREIIPFQKNKEKYPPLYTFRRTSTEWNEAAFVHLDRVLAEAAKNKLLVQICLANWWRDTGGVVEYLKWAGIKNAADPQSPHGIHPGHAMLFYTDPEARRLYREHLEKIVLRRNTITGVLYRDDPTIMGYELINEAQAVSGRWAERRAWFEEMSGYLKSLDPVHLITPGTWGYRTSWERREWLKDHQLSTIDYCDVHHYPKDDKDVFVSRPQDLKSYIGNRVAAAHSLKKPLVFGEFGIDRHGYHGFSRDFWFRSFLSESARAGVSGALYWIFTPQAHEGYNVSWAKFGDYSVREEIKQGSALFDLLSDDGPPLDLEKDQNPLVPFQSFWTNSNGSRGELPSVKIKNKSTLIYSLTPEMFSSARFEKMGKGKGFFWGVGVGELEYQIPLSHLKRKIEKVIVRAHLRPVLPPDADFSIKGSQVSLEVNQQDYGTRTLLMNEVRKNRAEEWKNSSFVPHFSDDLKKLSIRLFTKEDAEWPYGFNLSNFSDGRHAIEVEIVTSSL